MSRRIRNRRGTAATWTSVNPILGSGEIGIETDTRKFKIGNGSTAWTSLLYAAQLPSTNLDRLDGTVIQQQSALQVVPESLRNQNNGFVGINSSGEIVGRFSSRVDTRANIATIVLANGELAFTSDTNDMFRGNGVATGGVLVAGGRSIAANFGVSTSSTDLNTVISFPVAAGAVYRVKSLLKFANGAGGGNFQLQLAGSDGYTSGNMAGSLVSASVVLNWRDSTGAMLSQSDVLLLPATTLTYLCPFTTVTSSICELEYTFTPGTAGTMSLLVGQKTTNATPTATQWVAEMERLR